MSAKGNTKFAYGEVITNKYSDNGPKAAGMVNGIIYFEGLGYLYKYSDLLGSWEESQYIPECFLRKYSEFELSELHEMVESLERKAA